jgi:prepilin-type N-terminal cleavage/methylation domain-containing protein
MKKFKAFTIIELSISLLISGVVISIAYYSYLLLSKQYKTQLTKSDQIRECLLFRKIVQIDVMHSYFIKDSGSILLFENSNSSVLSTYDFEDSFVVRRHSEFTDTFHFKTDNYWFVHLNDSSSLINRIDILFNSGKDYFGASFNKVYSVQQLLMNRRTYE